MSDFTFAIPVTRAYEKDGRMFIEGTASTTEIDSHNTIFTLECQRGFVEDIEGGVKEKDPVLCEAEHKGDEIPVFDIGWVVKGSLNQERTEVVIELDPDNPVAVYYFNKLTKKDPKTGKVKRLGLSINGYAEKSHWNSDGIREFDRVKLRKVGIVRAPSNPSSYIKSILRSLETTEREQSKMENEKATEALTSALETDSGTANVDSPAETRSEQNEVENQESNTQDTSDADVKRGYLKDHVEYLFTAEKQKDIRDALNTLTRMTNEYLEYAQYFQNPEEETQKVINDFNDLVKRLFMDEEFAETLAEKEREYQERMKEYRAMSTENTTALQKEDLSEEVEVRSEQEQEVVSDSSETRSEEANVANQEVKPVVEYLTREQAADVMTNIVEEFVNRNIDDLKNTLKEKQGKIDELQRSVEELTERLKVVEQNPTSLPGALFRSEDTEIKEVDVLKRQYDNAIKEKNANVAIKALLGIKVD